MKKKKNTEYVTCRGSPCGTREHKENGKPTHCLSIYLHLSLCCSLYW